QHEHEGDGGGAEAQTGAGQRPDDVAHGHGDGDREGEMGEGERCVDISIESDAAEIEMAAENGEIPGEYFAPNHCNRPHHFSPRPMHAADEPGPPSTRITWTLSP